MSSFIRRVRVTALLSASGALVGAATAVALSFVATAVAQAMTTDRVQYYFGPLGFAIAGAIGTPLLAWLVMRRVPLWRAIAEPAIGGIVGTLVAIIAIPYGAPAILQPLCSFGGILGAAVRLRYAHRGAPEQLLDAENAGQA